MDNNQIARLIEREINERDFTVLHRSSEADGEHGMKFKITIKNPDAYSNALNKAAEEIVANNGTLDDDIPDAIDREYEKLDELCSKWFLYDEYLTVEIDTEAKTATVVPVKS